MTDKEQSPCKTCKVVKDPSDCERKQCKAWREWFIRRWEEMRGGK